MAAPRERSRQLQRPSVAVAGGARRRDRGHRLDGRLSHAPGRAARGVAAHPPGTGRVPGPVAGRHSAGAAVGSVERRLPARCVGVDARRDERGAGRLGARIGPRQAPGRHGRRRRLRRRRTRRSPAVRAERACDPGLATGRRSVRRRGRGAARRGHPSGGHAAADGAAVRRQRHLGRGRRCDRRGRRSRHPPRRRHAGRRHRGGSAGGRGGRAVGRARRGDDRPRGSTAVDHHDDGNAASPCRRRHDRHP